LDFGESQVGGTSIVGKYGTEGYLSPEMFLRRRYLPEKADIFAFGVLLFNLVFGGRPFGEAIRSDIFYSKFFTEDYLRFF